MSIEKELVARGISRSYPFYSIAKKHGVSYSSVLGVADNYREYKQGKHINGTELNATQQAAVDDLKESGVDIDSVLVDINAASTHFAAIQDGKIPAFPG